MINTVEKADSAIGLNLAINELDSYLSIPDPKVKCSLVYDGYLYVILGEIPGADEGTFPKAYRVSLTGQYAEPFNLSLNSDSSTEFKTAGVANMFDLPFSRSGFLDTDGTDNYVITLVETTQPYDGYSFARIGLTQGVFGSTRLLKIPGIPPELELSDITLIDGKFYFMSKSRNPGTVYDNIHTFDISTYAVTTTAITTPLLGDQTIVGYADAVYIFGGKEVDSGTGEHVYYNRKFYRIDTFALSILNEVILTGSTAGIIPPGLSYAPAAQEANRVYLISSEPYNATYMINLDSLISARFDLEVTGMDPKLAFIYDASVYSLNTNTMRLVWIPAAREEVSVEASTINFIITDPAAFSEEPYFEYTFLKKDKSIQVNHTKVIDISLIS